jgi:hypothetical protein
MRLFPQGTNGDMSWAHPPLFPADVFAAAAHLLHSSGGYQYIVAPFKGAGPRPASHYHGSTAGPSAAEMAEWIAAGLAWAFELDTDGTIIETKWRALWRRRNERLVVNPNLAGRPRWWSDAHALLVMADEASADLGYPITERDEDTPPEQVIPKWANRALRDNIKAVAQRSVLPLPKGADPGLASVQHFSRHYSVDSFCNDADRNVARVMPKARTTGVGCTLRTFSQNLALMSGHGTGNSYWHPLTWPQDLEEDLDRLNILLVPFPYKADKSSISGNRDKSEEWGRFQILQTWLQKPDGPGSAAESFSEFICALVESAERSDNRVHAVAFPEYALSWPIYDTVVRALRSRFPKMEFVIAGLSSDCNGRNGNQVVFSSFHLHPNDNKPVIESHSHRKHHRWLMGRAQIKEYGLEEQLDPNLTWWEYLEIEERVVNMDVFRKTSTIAVACAEDLVRVDPGLAMLRNVGPNLIVGLNMDGPQMKKRWVGRFSASLTDDPGSSVLILTSKAMINWSVEARTSENRGDEVQAPPETGIALWRNYPTHDTTDREQTVEIKLESGSQAVLIHLMSESARDITLDGRSNADATAWLFDSSCQVGLSASEIHDRGWTWIV